MNADAVLAEIVRLYNCHSAAQKLAEESRALAMLALQSDLYARSDARDATDNVLALCAAWEEANK